MPFDLGEVVELKPEKAPVAKNKFMGFLSFKKDGKEHKVPVELEDEDKSEHGASALATAQFAPAVVVPSERETALEAELLESRTANAKNFATRTTAGLGIGGERREEAETALSSLHLAAAQGKATPAQVEAAFSQLPTSSEKMSATLPAAQVAGSVASTPEKTELTVAQKAEAAGKAIVSGNGTIDRSLFSNLPQEVAA